MTNIKEKILKIVNDAFGVAPVITPAPLAAAPPAPAPTGPTPIPYTLSDGTAILILQAGQVPAVGDMVTNADGSLPAAGVLTFEDGSTATIDATGTITEVGAASPVTTDLAGAPPIPTLEERIAAIENRIAQAVAPARMEITKQEFDAVKDENAKLKTAFTDLTALVSELGGEPTATPETLTGAKKARFEKEQAKKEAVEAKEEKLARFAENIGKIRKNK